MTDPSQSTSLFAPPFSSAVMHGAVDDRVRLQRILDIELALAQAATDVGVIPKSAAGSITAACRAEQFDRAAFIDRMLAGKNPLNNVCSLDIYWEKT